MKFCLKMKTKCQNCRSKVERIRMKCLKVLYVDNGSNFDTKKRRLRSEVTYRQSVSTYDERGGQKGAAK